jgi:beta-lactamase regulating signal transducer with metallopeptidase domain
MASEVLHALVRANLVGGAAALAMLALRGPLRKRIGPNAVYALWMAVPASGLASLLPARTVTRVLSGAGNGLVYLAPPDVRPAFDWTSLFVAIWLIGAVVAFAWLAWRQMRFLRTIGRLEARGDILQASQPNVGPAVIGLIRPRILIPGDFETRFSAKEREVILAHERVHLARGDSRINGAVLAFQGLCWFNPLAYLAARALRLDQELACDATVMGRHPKARRSYAEAMLKSQVDAMALPVGCAWQAKGGSALSRRLTMLAAPPLSERQLARGVVIVVLLTSGAGVAAWSAQPVQERFVSEPVTRVSKVALPALAALPAPAARAAAVARPAAPALSSPAARPSAASAPQTAAQHPSSPGFQWGSMPMPADPDSSQGDIVASGASEAQLPATAGGHPQTVSTYHAGDYRMQSDFTPAGDKVQVTAQLYKSGDMVGTGTATTLPGETAYVALSNGQVAQVEPGQTAYLITPVHLSPARFVPPAPTMRLGQRSSLTAGAEPNPPFISHAVTIVTLASRFP